MSKTFWSGEKILAQKVQKLNVHKEVMSLGQYAIHSNASRNQIKCLTANRDMALLPFLFFFVCPIDI